MRYWLSFRGPFGTRPGVSVSGRELAAWGKKPPAVSANGMLGVFKRDTDGAIFLGVTDRNGENEHLANVKPVAVFAFSSADAAAEAREGALVRLATHVRSDGLIAGQSVGQVCAAIRSEANALGLDPQFARITIAAPDAYTERGFPWAACILAAVLITILALAVWGGAT
jgi:hypothetical protein